MDKGSETVTVDNPWTPMDTSHKGAGQTMDTAMDTLGHQPPWTKRGGLNTPAVRGSPFGFLGGEVFPSALRLSPATLGQTAVRPSAPVTS